MLYRWTQQKVKFHSQDSRRLDCGVSHSQYHLLKPTSTNVDASRAALPENLCFPVCLLLPGGLFPMSRISSASIVAKNTDVLRNASCRCVLSFPQDPCWVQAKKSCWSPMSVYGPYYMHYITVATAIDRRYKHPTGNLSPSWLGFNASQIPCQFHQQDHWPGSLKYKTMRVKL